MPNAEAADAGERDAVPWWSSQQPSATHAFPLTGLTTGVQALMSWAREQVLVPHAEHLQPRDHPQCLACRGQLVLAGVLGDAANQATEPNADVDDVGDQVQWIELDPPRA